MAAILNSLNNLLKFYVFLQLNSIDAAGDSAMQKKKRQTKTQKAGLTFPVSRFLRAMREAKYAKIIGVGAAVYLTAVLEYLAAEVMELAGNAARDNHKSRLTPR